MTVAGALHQDARGPVKEAAQLNAAKLQATLSILLGFCDLGAHAAWLMFALLATVQDQPSALTLRFVSSIRRAVSPGVLT